MGEVTRVQTAQLGSYMVSVKDHIQLETTRGYQSHLGVSEGWKDDWGFLGGHVVNC